MKSIYLSANGLRFHVVTEGRGELVLLLHGFPEYWYSWHKIIPKLAPFFKVAAPDMRGYGKTDKPKSVAEYHYKVLTKDIASIIESLGYKKAHVCGHDWGGGVAWEFAKLYPDIINKLVVLNCPPPARLLRKIFTSWKQFRMSWYIFFFQLPWLPEWYLHRDVKQLFVKMMRGWAIKKDAITDEMIAHYAEMFSQPSAFTGPVNYYRAAFRALTDKLFCTLPIYDQETLIIWGENDRALSKELTFELHPFFRKKLEIKYIPHCSHWILQEQPDMVAQFMREFLLK